MRPARAPLDEPVRADGPGRLADVYIAHFAQLTRLAALLVGNTAEAEEIAQEAYVRAARLTHEPADALPYLRQAVVNLSRSTLRRRLVARKHPPSIQPEEGEELDVIATLERAAIMRSLRQLPKRSREVLVLRYYSDLSVAQTAQTLGISVSAVTSYTSRGLAQLATLLKEA